VIRMSELFLIVIPRSAPGHTEPFPDAGDCGCRTSRRLRDYAIVCKGVLPQPVFDLLVNRTTELFITPLLGASTGLDCLAQYLGVNIIVGSRDRRKVQVDTVRFPDDRPNLLESELLAISQRRDLARVLFKFAGFRAFSRHIT
jgi:hypothetical protein